MSFFDDLKNGTTKIIFGTDEGEPETLTVGEARAGALVLTTAATIGASMYTRKRVAEGHEPIAKVLF